MDISKPTVRAAVAADIPALKDAIGSTGLFPPDMLDDMMAGYLAGGDELWLVADREGSACAVAYCAPEKLTDGTWNMYLLAVHADDQGTGAGRALVQSAEERLAGRGVRILLVETSGLPEFERTRRFYERNGYVIEARIQDFYEDGNDKVVFRKVLRGGGVAA
jgi:ribosomal protein S18 acetylase RimI-like enzyme